MMISIWGFYLPGSFFSFLTRGAFGLAAEISPVAPSPPTPSSSNSNFTAGSVSAWEKHTTYNKPESWYDSFSFSFQNDSSSCYLLLLGQLLGSVRFDWLCRRLHSAAKRWGHGLFQVHLLHFRFAHFTLHQFDGLPWTLLFSLLSLHFLRDNTQTFFSYFTWHYSGYCPISACIENNLLNTKHSLQSLIQSSNFFPHLVGAWWMISTTEQLLMWNFSAGGDVSHRQWLKMNNILVELFSFS